nr:hypothetical protein [Pseudomonas sp. 460]
MGCRWPTDPDHASYRRQPRL